MTERSSTSRHCSRTDRTTGQTDASTDTPAELSPVAASGFDKGAANRAPLSGASPSEASCNFTYGETLVNVILLAEGEYLFIFP